MKSLFENRMSVQSPATTVCILTIDVKIGITQNMTNNTEYILNKILQTFFHKNETIVDLYFCDIIYIGAPVLLRYKFWNKRI